MRSLNYILFIVAFSLSAIGCHRKQLEQVEYGVAYIPITTDWSNSLVETASMGNISIHIFPKSGGEPTVVVSDNQIFNVVQLPIGRYSILIFNEMIGDLKGVEFQDESDFDKISVNITQKSEQPTYHTVSDSEHLTNHHDHIAAWHLSELVVDADMVEYTTTDKFREYIAISQTRSNADSRATLPESKSYIPTRSLDSLSSSTPTPVTTILNITVRVENLNSAASIEAILSGTASGSTLVSRSSTSTTGDLETIYDFFFNDWRYDDPTNGIDGEVNYTINTFVSDDDESQSYKIKFSILLHTGEILTLYRDVTTHILSDDDHEIDLIIDDEKITLPEYEEAGFNVDGWGDAIQVPL